MAKTAERIVSRARALVGQSRNQVGCAGAHAWCAHFISNVLRYIGIDDMYDLSCTSMQAKMAKSPKWSEPEDNPKPGDILFFDWDHIIEERPLDHVGVVEKFDASTGTITYINGNGSSSYYVTRQTININNSTISYWMRYVGDDVETPEKPIESTVIDKKAIKYCTVELEVLSKGCESPSVETLQNLLVDLGYDIEVDGNFWTETEAAVKKFQDVSKLTVDGVVGAKTWKALIEAE